MTIGLSPPPAPPSSYAFTLGHLAEFCSTRRRELLATEMAHPSSNISERIEMLLRPRFHFSTSASLSRVSFCVVAGLALLGLSVRMPGWIVFAKDTTAAVAKNQAASPQSPAAHIVSALQTSPVGAALVAALSPAYAAQSSAAPRWIAQMTTDLAARMEALARFLIEHGAVLAHQPR